ncbi:MAG: cytochrome P450 [Candidatus Tectomicrobia bacterium]|nr:cytochrome P450 [Candidatus Tectomicrobia bacterium]
MLRFADELLLLLIDDKRGGLIPIPEWSLGCALAGALLMDLAQERRIDTDPDYLSLLDATPLGDDLLDPVLEEIARAEAAQHARFWVAYFARQGDDIRDRTLARLTAQGILEGDEEGGFSFLPSVSRTRRYPAGEASREDVQLRIMRVLFSNDVPDPDDGVIVGLANACGVFERLLSPAEREAAQERIALLGRMDLIGRAVTEVIEAPPAAAGPHGAPYRGREIPTVQPSLTDLLLGRAFVLDQYRRHGPIFQVRKNLLIRFLEAIFITKPLAQRGKKNDRTLIFLAGPEANMFFQKNDRNYFRNREFWMRFDEQFDARATRSTISTSGEDHFRMRRAKRAGYSRTVGETQLAGILDVTRREAASWRGGKPLAGTAMGKRLVYNLMCRLMAGVSAPEYYDDFITLFETAFRAIHGRYPARPAWPRLRRARRRMDELTARIIALHEPQNRGSRPPDIIDHLLALYRADPQFLPETDLGIALLEPIYAPLDTMAHTISFMLYELLTDPGLLRRARAEADELFAHGTPTTQGIQQLDVIKRAYLETLRLHSTVPLTIRTAANSFEFAGCTVAAGSPVVLQFTLAHHMAAYFPDPERFDIDRFAPPRNEHQQPGVYMPYGVGTHRCLGSNLAEFTATTAMATLLRDVELALAPPDYVLTPRKIKRIPTRHPDKSFKFRLVRRRTADTGASASAASGAG